MPEVRTTIPAAELTPGQYFRVNDRWYRAAGPVIQLEGKAPQLKAINAVNGDSGWMWLHAERVTVNEGNAIPPTFQAATLERKADAARQKAAELNRAASQLETLALETRHGISLGA
jgi:hypothetical protein